MSQPDTAGATRADTPPPDPKDASTADKPPLQTETIASVQADVDAVQQGISR